MADIDEILMSAEERMEKAITALKENFMGVRTGRANAMVLDRIKVDYYGVPTPVNQMAGVKTPEAHLLVIEPWDKGMLRAIEHAILESDLGVTPNNDGSPAVPEPDRGAPPRSGEAVQDLRRGSARGRAQCAPRREHRDREGREERQPSRRRIEAGRGRDPEDD